MRIARFAFNLICWGGCRMKKFKTILAALLVSAMVGTSFAPVAFATETTKAETTTAATEKKEVKAEVASNVIDIVTFNDFHGNLKESGKNVGMAKMIAVANEKQAANENTIVVSGGDNYQGSAMSNLTYGKPVNDMFKAMNVEVSAVGNHEFDWGTSYMKEWQERGDFSFLAANVVEEATGKTPAWAKPYQIVEKNGKKIAFIGLSTVYTLESTSAKSLKGLDIKNAAETAKEWVEFLKAGKAEEGTPDAIFALTHVPSWQDKYGSDPTIPVTGEEMVELAKVEGLNGVISGHSHQTVAGYVEKMPVVQAYKYGRAMGKMSVEFKEDGTVVATPSIDLLYKRSGDIVASEEGTKTYAKWEEELKPIMHEKVGVATETFGHDTSVNKTTALGSFVCKLMGELADAPIAIQNGGGLRRDMPKGDLTMGLMYEIMPFDNTLYTIEITGADLKMNIDNGLQPENAKAGSFSGLYVEYDMSKAAGERIVKITLEDGTPIEADKYYKVVSNDFLVENPGADGYDFSKGKNPKNLMVPIRDAMADYIKEKGTVTPEVVDYEVNVEGKTDATEVAKEEPKKEEVKEVAKEEVKESASEDQEATKVNAQKEKADASYTVYTVQSGDVLWKIAEKFGMTYKELGELNNLKDVNMIHVGQQLKVPSK